MALTLLTLAAPADAVAQNGAVEAAPSTGAISAPARVKGGAGATTRRRAARGPTSLRTVPRLQRMSRSVMAGQLVRAEGRLGSGRGSRRILLETRAGGRWRTVAEAGTSSRGTFRLSWRPAGPGRYTVRARPKRGLAPRRVRSRTVTVYRQALASWFGPGLYGRRTACGQALHPGLLGVAHKGLPCGTRVTFAYGGRTVTVPVVDRGPFVGSREWDLTGATRERLGFPSTGLVLSSR